MVALVTVPVGVGIEGAVLAPIFEVIVAVNHQGRLAEEGAISVLDIGVIQDNAGEVAATAQPRGLHDMRLVDSICHDQGALFFGVREFKVLVAEGVSEGLVVEGVIHT